MKYEVEKHGVYHDFKVCFRCECGRPNTSREKVKDNDD